MSVAPSLNIIIIIIIINYNVILVLIGEENIPVPLTGRYNDTKTSPNTYIAALALSANQHINSTD